MRGVCGLRAAVSWAARHRWLYLWEALRHRTECRDPMCLWMRSSVRLQMMRFAHCRESCAMP